MAITATAAMLTASSVFSADTDWKEKSIAPGANPIYFEDPRIYSEVRPVFMQHYLPDTFHFSGGKVPLGGDVRVYAAQVRYAVNDRLALIATKDGYIEAKPDKTLKTAYGWADLAAGVKYALVDDRANQFIFTSGVTITLPTGTHEVFQGVGGGEWNVFASAAKGFDELQVMANAGFRIPNNFSEQTAQAHYSLQVSYYTCQYFIPFVVANGYTVLTEGNNKLLGAVPLDTELYDLGNFGSTDAAGTTQITVGGGARAKLTKNVELGASYETAVTSKEGIFDSRVTADVSVHW